jgi:cytochrome P450
VPRPAPKLATPDFLRGHLAQFRDDPLGLIARAQATHGDAVWLRVGPVKLLFLFHPEAVQHVLVTKVQQYTKRTRGYAVLKLLLGEGLVTSDGALWRRQRRIAQPAFVPKSVGRFAEQMVQCAADTAERWRVLAEQRAEVDVANEMMALTLRIACLTLFSYDPSGDTDEVAEAVKQLLQHFNRLVVDPKPWPGAWPTAANRAFKQNVAVLDKLVFRLIAERRKATDPGDDLLGMLLSARDPETGEAMDDGQLRDEVVTMLLAGHETTANALNWTFHFLALHPEVAAKLDDELARVLPNGQLPTRADAAKLPYLTQVIQESMRLRPPVWLLGRRAEADDVIGDIQVPKGAWVYLSQFHTHRHLAFWPEPELFQPERFATKREGLARYAWFPFATGQRACIGEHFAMLEAQLLLATLWPSVRMQHVDVSAVVLDPSLTLRPRDGLVMRFEGRVVG